MGKILNKRVQVAFLASLNKKEMYLDKVQLAVEGFVGILMF